MKLHGTLLSNLQGAVTSATRLEKQRVYTGTLDHWQALVNEARRRLELDDLGDPTDVRRLTDVLEKIVARRKVIGGRPT